MTCERCGGDSGPYRAHPDPQAACLLAKGIAEDAHDLYQRASGMDDVLARLDQREGQR